MAALWSPINSRFKPFTIRMGGAVRLQPDLDYLETGSPSCTAPPTPQPWQQLQNTGSTSTTSGPSAHTPPAPSLCARSTRPHHQPQMSGSQWDLPSPQRLAAPASAPPHLPRPQRVSAAAHLPWHNIQPQQLQFTLSEPFEYRLFKGMDRQGAFDILQEGWEAQPLTRNWSGRHAAGNQEQFPSTSAPSTLMSSWPPSLERRVDFDHEIFREILARPEDWGAQEKGGEPEVEDLLQLLTAQ